MAHQAVQTVVAFQEIQTLRRIPGPALGLMESLAQRECIINRHDTRIEAYGFPSLIPDGSVMARKVVIVSPRD